MEGSFEPVLYVLIMDQEVDSMNYGKGAAQACHAGSDFTMEMTKLIHSSTQNYMLDESHPEWREIYQEWMGNRGWGTVITLEFKDHIPALSDNVPSFKETSIKAAKDLSIIHGKILDPTYPVTDGRTTHLVPFVTCHWFFIDNADNGTDSGISDERFRDYKTFKTNFVLHH